MIAGAIALGWIGGFVYHALSTSRRFCGCGNPRATQEALQMTYRGYAVARCLNCDKPQYFEGAAP